MKFLYVKKYGKKTGLFCLSVKIIASMDILCNLSLKIFENNSLLPSDTGI